MNRLEDLREWLTAKIDGSEETRGEDSLISHFINQIDALPSSEMGTIPDAERKKVMDAQLAATVEPRGCPTPGSCSAVAELADLKQRILPQFQGRAQRAEHERDALLEKLIAARSAMQQAYGCLWRYTGSSNPMFLQARKMLLARLTKEQQASGIRYANELFGHTTEHEILHSDCSHDAPPSATAATDRPDWAQQLPGAEIFDRAARYEYIRTLNPRKFAALYNEALMGVHQFDDLVDRYRAGGLPK